MRKGPALTLAAAAALAGGLGATPALANNPHFTGELSFTDVGSQLLADGRVAGLGNKSVTVSLVADGFGTARCRNKGGNEAPGRNPVTFRVSGSTVVLDTDHNGNEAFSLSTGVPGNPTAREAGCPNNNWTATFVDVRFTRAVLSIPGDTVVCDFGSGGTSDGDVSAGCS